MSGLETAPLDGSNAPRSQGWSNVPPMRLRDQLASTTTAAKPIGECVKCGQTRYEGLVHFCPTNAARQVQIRG